MVLRFLWQPDLPAPVRADVDVITSSERLPRFTDKEREAVRARLRELLLQDEPGHAGPSQWRKAIEDKFGQTLRELHPLRADMLLAIALRGHTWQAQGESSWDLFRAGGKVLEGFEQASSGAGRLAVAMYRGFRDWLGGRAATAAAQGGARSEAVEGGSMKEDGAQAPESRNESAEGQCPSQGGRQMAPPEGAPTNAEEGGMSSEDMDDEFEEDGADALEGARPEAEQVDEDGAQAAESRNESAEGQCPSEGGRQVAPPESAPSNAVEGGMSSEETDPDFEEDAATDDDVASEEDVAGAGAKRCCRSSASASTCDDEWPETFPCSFAPPPPEARQGVANRVAEASAIGAAAHADAWAAASYANVATAQATGASASATVRAVGAEANVANAAATGVAASVSASATGAEANVANVSVTGASASAAASAVGVQANVGNVSVTGASVSATASVQGASANVGNVSVQGAGAHAFADVGLGVDVGNVSVSGPSSVSVGVRVGKLSIGNVSVGGLSFVLDLNPINWFLNIGLGGGGGGGGGKKGGGGEEGHQGDGQQAGTPGATPAGGQGTEVGAGPHNGQQAGAPGAAPSGGQGANVGAGPRNGQQAGAPGAAPSGAQGAGVGEGPHNGQQAGAPGAAPGGGQGAGVGEGPHNGQQAGAPGAAPGGGPAAGAAAPPRDGQLAEGHRGPGHGAGQVGGGGDRHGGAPDPQGPRGLQPAPTGEGPAARVARLVGELQERFPNVHYDFDGSRYRNGVLDKLGKVREARALDRQVPEGAPVEPTARGDEQRRRDAREGRPDPLGAGLDAEGEHRRVLANVGAPEEAVLSSCVRFAQAAYAHTEPDSRTQLRNIGAKEVPRMLDMYLREPNSMAVVSLKFVGPQGGQGDHHFVVTGHGDQVQVSHAWQHEHGPRNEKPMPREQFVRDWQTLQSRAATQQQRRAAFRRIFPAAPGEAGEWKVGVDAAFVGRTGRPMVNVGGHEGAPGLRPARREILARPIPLQLHQRRAKRKRTGAGELAAPPPGSAADTRGAAEPSRTGEGARALGSAGGQGVPGAPGGSGGHGGRGPPVPVDPEALALLRELAHADGLPFSDGDLQAFVAAGGVSAARERAERMEKEEEEKGPKELCDFCKQRGKPCCMKCLLSDGSRKVVKLRGNVHGFVA